MKKALASSKKGLNGLKGAQNHNGTKRWPLPKQCSLRGLVGILSVRLAT